MSPSGWPALPPWTLSTWLNSWVNDFYRLLAQGTLKAAAHYGGTDFACVLGQKMAGYAYDQQNQDQDEGKALDLLMADEASRASLTSWPISLPGGLH